MESSHLIIFSTSDALFWTGATDRIPITLNAVKTKELLMTFTAF